MRLHSEPITSHQESTPRPERHGTRLVTWAIPASGQAELAPAGDTTCVSRDSTFADDVAKTNLAAILQQHGIQNVRSL